MTDPTPDRARLLRRLAWTGAALALGLIVLGGVVRITGSGMGCGDHWPRCNGQWFPPLDLPTLIEIGHRWAAALVSLLVLARGGWWPGAGTGREPAPPEPATLALVLLVVQVLLGAVTVKLALPPWVIITHLANAMLLLAAAGGGRSARRTRRHGASAPHSARHGAHGLVLARRRSGSRVILFGAQVANFHAGLLCLGFPLCNGSAAPARDGPGRRSTGRTGCSPSRSSASSW